MTVHALASPPDTSSLVPSRRRSVGRGAHRFLRLVPGQLAAPRHPRAAAPADDRDSAGAGRSALTTYLAQLREYPLLDRDEEQALALEFVRTGDPALGRRLVTANLRLVVKIGRDYQRGHGNFLDLIQEGNIGLLHAVRKYDPTRGVKLSSYAAWWIRAFMLKFILDNWRIVKLGTTQAQRRLFFNLPREHGRLERAGVEAQARQVADSLGVRESEVLEMQARLSSSDASLDALDQRGTTDHRHDATHARADDATRPDLRVEESEFQTTLRSALTRFSADLPEREQYILRARLWCDDPVTLDQIGRRYGVTRERARQVESRLKTWLRTYLADRLGPAVGGEMVAA